MIRVPEIRLTAPARLPHDPLPASSIPASVQVVTGDDLRRSGAANLQDLLVRRLPGATLSDEQGNALQPSLLLRGFQVSSITGAPQGLSVFVDGVRVNEPAVEEVNFDLIPLDDIERIEVIRGPAAVFGRNTLGGVLNIITRRGGERTDVVPEAEGGSFGRQQYRLHAAGRGGPLDYYVSGTLFREEGWRDASASHVGRAFGSLGYRADGTDLAVTFQYAGNRIQQPGSLPLTELRQDRTLNFTGGDFFRPRLALGTLNLRQELSDNVGLSLNAFGRGLETEQFNANLLGEDTRAFNTTRSFGGTLQITVQGSVAQRPNRLVLGLDYVHHDARVRVFEERTMRELDTDVRDRQHGAGVYLQDTLELARSSFVDGDSVVLTAAARWDWLHHDIADIGPPSARPNASGTSTFTRANPSLGLNYNLTRDVGAYAALSQGFRAPAFLELTCAGPGAVCPGLQAGVAPDPALKSVKATTYEVGLRARPAPWLEGELSLFRTDVVDDIFSVSPTGTTGVFFQNIGDTRRQGLELSLRGTWGRNLQARIGYAYTEGTFRDDIELATPRQTAGCTASPCTESVRKGDELPLIPRHRLSAGVDYRLTSWLTASVSGLYVGAQRLRGDEENVEPRLKGYAMLNAGLRAEFKRLAAFASIMNLTNNEYETFGTFARNAKLEGAPVERFLTPAPPLHVVGGLSYRF